jgi:NAD dependent epimerase/dehydratase
VKALVTGADGFIGSHLAEMLLAKGWRVRALSLYNSFNDRGWLESVPAHEHLEAVAGDIRDPFFCSHICEGVDVIFHLAALIAIPFSYLAPQSYVETNILGTMNMCQAALQHKVKRMIQTSTSEIYGSARYVPIDENHPPQPQSPYSASKIGADAIALSYYNAFSLPLTVARPFNTFGPRQSARAIIPAVISQIASGQKEIHVGDLTPTRDFNYVSDTCAGFIALAQAKGVEGEVFNFGSGAEISIGDLIETIARLMDADVRIVQDEKRMRPEKSEVNRLLSDSGKAKERLGFAPEVSLEDGLSRTIAWFKNPENLRRYKPHEYNI